MLSRIAVRGQCPSRNTMTWVLTVLASLLIGMSPGTAGSEPKTVNEIALYQGPDREKSLTEGATIWDLWLSGEVPYSCAIGVMLMTVLALLLYTGRMAAMRRARQF